MHDVPLSPELFQGHISLERVEGGIRPWRIPHERRALFPPNAIGEKGRNATGVRLRFESDTSTVEVAFAPFETVALFDLVIDNDIIATQKAEPGATSVRFEGLPREPKVMELYLPHAKPIAVKGVRIDEGSSISIPGDTRIRWVAYGSSITECAGAASPAQTWPAIVARLNGWHLTSLGYGGNCHLEPNVARMIRDLPADAISLCLGINVYGAASLGPRTFRAAVIGFIEILREKHSETPISVLSPIISPPRETTPNAVGFTLQALRNEVREAVLALQEHGDSHLVYIDGREVFGEAEAESHLPDALHPDAEGYRIMGRNFDAQVIKPLQATYANLRSIA